MRTKTFSKLMLAAGILAFTATALQAQVGINNTGTTPNASAILDLQTGNTGVNKGFLPQAVALTANNVAAPVTGAATGLIVYNTATAGASPNNVVPGYYYWNGSAWLGLGAPTMGSGTLNYLARWTPDGNTLGIGATQDNGTEVGIDTASYPGVSLFANASSTNGNLDAVIGYTNEPGYVGVAGLSVGYGGAGLIGEAIDGVGVEGVAEDIGVFAEGDTIGVKAFGDTAVTAYGNYSGVNAYGPTLGVFAVSNSGYGVLGEGVAGVVGVDYGSDEGVLADSSEGYGVAGSGYNEGGYFVDGAGDVTKLADNVNGYGITAYAANTGGYFQDDAGASSFDYAYIAYGPGAEGGYFEDAGGDYSYISYAGYGILSSGTKSTMVKDENNQERVLFCDESPEVVFHDYGTAQLVNGKVHINLDPLFAKTVAINEKHPLRVMVTLNDECNGVFVKNRTATGFDVIELNHGTSDAAFTYEIIANRADTKNAKGETYDYSNWRYPVGPGAIAPTKHTADKPLINGKKVSASHSNNGIKHHANISTKMPLTAAQTQGKN